MEIQLRYLRQRTEFGYLLCHGKSIPTRKTLIFIALDIEERIADVLKVEMDTALFQPCSSATPLTEKMTVRPPDSVSVAVRVR